MTDLNRSKQSAETADSEDRSVRSAVELVNIFRMLPQQDQQNLLEFARALKDRAKTKVDGSKAS